jgi:RNA polymerase sigma-70 factor (family 1)
LNKWNEDNETFLFTRIAQGDTAAFEQFYRRFRNKAYAISLTYLSDPAEAEDILQNFFLKVWQIRNEFLQINDPARYVFIMLRNMVISELRSKKRQERIKSYLEKTAESLPAQLVSDANDINRIINDAIRRLPEKQQKIFQMSRVQGLSHEQIGEHLNLSPRTISNTLSLVLAHLRTVLRKAGLLFFWYL